MHISSETLLRALLRLTVCLNFSLDEIRTGEVRVGGVCIAVAMSPTLDQLWSSSPVTIRFPSREGAFCRPYTLPRQTGGGVAQLHGLVSRCLWCDIQNCVATH